MAAEGKDIAWAQWAYCGGALVAGVVIGALVVAPVWEKAKAKKAAKKGGQPKDASRPAGGKK